MLAGAIAGGLWGSIGAGFGNVLITFSTSIETLDSLKDIYKAVLSSKYLKSQVEAQVQTLSSERVEQLVTGKVSVDTQLRTLGSERLNELVFGNLVSLDQSGKPIATYEMIDEIKQIIPNGFNGYYDSALGALSFFTEHGFSIAEEAFVFAGGMSPKQRSSHVEYSTLKLIEDIRNELSTHSELLAQIFPERVNSFSDRDLSRLWRGSNYQYISRVINKITNPNNKDYKPDFKFLDTETSLQLLEKKLSERLGAKAIGCMRIIHDYKNPASGITTLRFIEMLENELGRISGDVIVTNEELSLILAGDKDFIHRTLDTIRNPQSKRWYNPDYKFTLERLDYFRRSFQNILGFKAKKLLDHINQYHLSNPDLQYWHPKDYSIKRENFFSEVNLIVKAYWLGFLSADGYLNSKRPRISIELSIKDEEIISHFCDTIGLDKSRISRRQRFWKYKGEIRTGWTSSIKFSSTQVAEDLKNLEFLDLKSGKAGLPSIIKSLILKAKIEAKSKAIPWYSTYSGLVAHAWLLGFYDGDGTYIGGNQGRIYSSNMKILYDIKSLFEINNKVYLQTDISKYLEDGKEIPEKLVYGLNLGPDVFQSMMDSYLFSLSRKRNTVYRNQRYVGDYI